MMNWTGGVGENLLQTAKNHQFFRQSEHERWANFSKILRSKFYNLGYLQKKSNATPPDGGLAKHFA